MVDPPANRVNILGVGISALDLDQAVRRMAGWIDTRELRYVNVCTVHTIMECRRSSRLRGFVNGSGMATPDGMPLVWLCRRHGKDCSRVYGPDLLLAFCKYSENKGYRHFFYGGARGVSGALAQTLKERYPNLRIAGALSPPFRGIGAMEDPEVIAEINGARPDILWVGLGTPKQDFWVARHRPLLDAPVLVAVGAAFDFVTGRIPQAPGWMQESGLEWLFRLCHEPRRLWHRYMVYNPLFVLLAAAQAMGMAHYPIEKHTSRDSGK